MILDSFKLLSTVHQIEYENAYLLWDRSGRIASDASAIWGELSVEDARPNVQALYADGLSISTEFNKATVTLAGGSLTDSARIMKLQQMIELWRSHLELDEVKRLSTKVTYMREFQSLGQANKYLRDLGLVNWPKVKVFDQPVDSEINGYEVMYRFEDKSSFSLIRFRAEALIFEANLDPMFFDEKKMKKERFRVVVDFDRGVLGKVSVSKLRIDEWVKGFAHIMRRDLDKLV